MNNEVVQVKGRRKVQSSEPQETVHLQERRTYLIWSNTRETSERNMQQFILPESQEGRMINHVSDWGIFVDLKDGFWNDKLINSQI